MVRRDVRLAQLYAEMHEYALERDRGSTPLHPRIPVARSLDGALVLLGQGLAQSTQRVTGYPYRSPEGLSPAGRRLDGYLRAVAYTINHRDQRRTYAYSTDLVPWYPGKDPSGKGDLRPSAADVERCWRWFEREVELVQPRAVVLLGKWTADRFLRRYGQESLGGRRLRDVAGQRFSAVIGGQPISAVAVYHPSAIWGKLEADGDASWRRAIPLLKRGLAGV